MIFAHTLEQVIRGQKSQTRRLIKPDEIYSDNTKVTKLGKRIIYEVGRSYAVQPNRGKKSVARILLTGLRKEPIIKISHGDAKAEGFKNRQEFIDTWRKIHGETFDLNTEVWVLEFELLTITDDKIRGLYGKENTTNTSIDNGQNISRSIKKISRVSMYSRNYRAG